MKGKQKWVCQHLHENLVAALLEDFPRLEERCFRDIVGYPDVGPFVVFGDVFNYYLREWTTHSQSERSRIGAFVEEMASPSDVYVEDLTRIEVLPVFLESQAILDAYWQQLGPRTRRGLMPLATRTAPAIQMPESD